MAFLSDLDYRDEAFAIIQQRLSRRGLKMTRKRQWEKHGPHGPRMPFMVYVGYAKEGKVEFPVAVYLRAVYEVYSTDDWDRIVDKIKVKK